MPKLSRVQRYQVLRDRLDEETTESQQEQNKQSLQRLSRVANKDTNTLSHASDPRRASTSENEPVQTISSNLVKSPVMDNLLDEVKQYNLDAGNTVWDDTQFNILKQLDGTQAKHRTQHFVPMEENEEDDLGSTMQLPITKIKAVDELAKSKKLEETKDTVSDEANGPTILPMSKTPLPFYPIEEEEVEEPKEEKEESEDKIVLSQEDFVEEDDIESTFERLVPLEAYTRPEATQSVDEKEIEETKKQPLIKKKVEKKKKEHKKPEIKKPEKPKETKAIVKKAAPVTKKAEVKVEKTKKEKPDSSRILNIVLVVLIILLFIAILATVLMMRSLAA